jgi:hypothetical protein
VIATFCLPTVATSHGATKSTGQQITMHFSDQHLAVQQLIKDMHFNLDDALGPIRIPYEQPRTLAEILHRRMEHDQRISLYGTSTTGRLNKATTMESATTSKRRAPDDRHMDTRRSAKKARPGKWLVDRHRRVNKLTNIMMLIGT